jgi:hypothetical protein
MEQLIQSQLLSLRNGFGPLAQLAEQMTLNH